MRATELLDALDRGPHTAAELGLGPARLDALCAELRGEGVGLDRQGDRVAMTDPAGFGPRVLAWRCGLPVRFFDETDSTNDRARQLAGTHRGPWPLVVVARRQRAGRGRQGRRWESAPDQNLLMSAVLRPRVAPSRAARAVLVWAAAVAEVLDVRVKWPNDLVDTTGQKLGGVLAELDLAGDRIRHVVLGLGLNINQRQFPGLPLATSLARVRGEDQDRAAVCGLVVRALAAVEDAVLDGPAGLALWRRRADTLGRQVRIRGIDGQVVAEGLAEDIRDDGALMVEGVPVLTGDVALLG